MIRCFLSDRSQWTIDEDVKIWIRVPRWPNAPHPGVEYSKTQGTQELGRYFLWTLDEIMEDPEFKQHFHNALVRAHSIQPGEFYLYVESPDGYWIDTVVKEVFP